MFLSLRRNEDKLATALGVTSSVAAAVGVLAVAAMFSPLGVIAATATLLSAVALTEGSNKLIK